MPRQSKSEEVVMAGDGGRVPDVSEQRADHEDLDDGKGWQTMSTVCERCGSADPASVLAALLAESPEATVAAIEALLTSDDAVAAFADASGWHLYHRIRDGQQAAVRSLLSKAPKEDGDA